MTIKRIFKTLILRVTFFPGLRVALILLVALCSTQCYSSS